MPNADDVNYKPEGEVGKQCKDCGEFAVHSDNAAEGDCHGHKVDAIATCSFFHSAKE